MAARKAANSEDTFTPDQLAARFAQGGMPSAIELSYAIVCADVDCVFARLASSAEAAIGMAREHEADHAHEVGFMVGVHEHGDGIERLTLYTSE